MINSNNRKLLLSGWLQENGAAEYDSPLKLQKFLLLYEAFTKISGEKADFSRLKGYKRGPVFSTVWGDYTHERRAFNDAAEKEYSAHKQQINEERAKRSKFIVSILSEKELSELTHKLNIWKSKKTRIMNNEWQVDLSEDDFNEDDAEIIAMLDKMYPASLIENSVVIQIDNHYFIFCKEDARQLTESHFDTLSAIADSGEAENPIYAELDEEGRIIVD